MKHVTPDTPINLIFKYKKGSAKVLKHFGLQCAGCRGAATELLRHAAEIHGIDLNDILKLLNSSHTNKPK